MIIIMGYKNLVLYYGIRTCQDCRRGANCFGNVDCIGITSYFSAGGFGNAD